MFPPKMLRVGLSVPVLLFAVMPNLRLASLQKVFPAANLGQMASGNACRYLRRRENTSLGPLRKKQWLRHRRGKREIRVPKKPFQLTDL